jgi:glycosyltransferase involved in cell wall biosynthesis
MPDWLVNLKQKNVKVVGEVPDAASFVCSKTISIAPLLSGSGIRIKIIESMAYGKAVVSTTIGAEGINYTHKKNIFIADTPEDFAAAIQFLHLHPEQCAEIGDAARELIRQQHNTGKIIQELVSFYREIL